MLVSIVIICRSRVVTFYSLNWKRRCQSFQTHCYTTISPTTYVSTSEPHLQLLDINLTVFLIQLIRYFYYLENVHIS